MFFVDGVIWAPTDLMQLYGYYSWLQQRCGQVPFPHSHIAKPGAGPWPQQAPLGVMTPGRSTEVASGHLSVSSSQRRYYKSTDAPTRKSPRLALQTIKSKHRRFLQKKHHNKKCTKWLQYICFWLKKDKWPNLTQHHILAQPASCLRTGSAAAALPSSVWGNPRLYTGLWPWTWLSTTITRKKASRHRKWVLVLRVESNMQKKINNFDCLHKNLKKF